MGLIKIFSRKISFKKFTVAFSIIIIALYLVFLVAGLSVQADVGSSETSGTYTIPNPFGAKTFEEVLGKIDKWLIAIAIPIASIVILYAAFLFMTSAGNEEKVTKAKRALTWALVGIGILVIGTGFVTLIKDILSSTSTTNNPATTCASDGQSCTTSSGVTGICSWESANKKFVCSATGSSTCSSDGTPCITSSGGNGICSWEAATKKFVCN